jgi:hypothetical protein
MTYNDEIFEFVQMDERPTIQREKENEENGYYILKRKKEGVIKKIGCYGSGSQGTSIRNAITGERIFSHKVGSRMEDLYFKVTISLGISEKGPVTLFFENPEQFERHLFEEVKEEEKKKWRLRVKSLVKNLS